MPSDADTAGVAVAAVGPSVVEGVRPAAAASLRRDRHGLGHVVQHRRLRSELELPSPKSQPPYWWTQWGSEMPHASVRIWYIRLCTSWAAGRSGRIQRQHALDEVEHGCESFEDGVVLLRRVFGQLGHPRLDLVQVLVEGRVQHCAASTGALVLGPAVRANGRPCFLSRKLISSRMTQPSEKISAAWGSR